VPSARKAMLMLFWFFNVPIPEHYQYCRQKVNSSQYCAMLEEELKPAIHSKHRGKPTNEVVQHNDNAQPHMGAATIEII
jgi:hypothetical protein